jgi:endogenous inhibitor of DNA gyrase (YacG/DUF329 family)
MTKEEKEQVARHRNNGLAYSEISKVLDVSVNTIKSYCRRNGLADKKEPAKEDFNEQNTHCKQCGKALIQVLRGKPKKFCSEKCRRDWWQENQDQQTGKAYYTIKCDGCGVTFESYGNRDRKFCSHACYIKSRFGRREGNEPSPV